MPVDETIKLHLDLSGVSKWHSAGFKGKGIVILNLEDEGSTHSEMSYNCVKWVAPEATILRASLAFTANSAGITRHEVCDDGIYHDIEEYVRDNKVKIITYSMEGTHNPSEHVAMYWNYLAEKYNLILFNSAGNDGAEDNYTETPFSYESAFQIGAIYSTKKRAVYSSLGEELDFVGLTFLYTGTSFSCPFIAAMAALICSRYGDLPKSEMELYLKRICEDLGESGRDIKYGWGFPVMPDVNEKYVTIKIGERSINIDGVTVPIDTEAIIDKNGRTLVPVRVIAEAFGYTVSWDNDQKKVIIAG